MLVGEPNETDLEIITQSVHLSTGYVFLTKVKASNPKTKDKLQTVLYCMAWFIYYLEIII